MEGAPGTPVLATKFQAKGGDERHGRSYKSGNKMVEQTKVTVQKITIQKKLIFPKVLFSAFQKIFFVCKRFGNGLLKIGVFFQLFDCVDF